MKKIILASASEQRKLLLENIGLKFKVEKSDYEEDMGLKLKPRDLAIFLSRGKAKTIAEKYKNAIIIGADTFIVYKGKLLGKPYTRKKAINMLKELNGKWHSLITGFTVIDTENNRIVSDSEETKVFIKKLSHYDIDEYVKTGEPLNKAGSYAAMKLGSCIIEKINGSHSNVSGLPMAGLKKALKKFDINIFDKKWRKGS